MTVQCHQDGKSIHTVNMGETLREERSGKRPEEEGCWTWGGVSQVQRERGMGRREMG